MRGGGYRKLGALLLGLGLGLGLVGAAAPLRPLWAQDQGLSALARLDASRTRLVAAGAGVEIALGLSQPVPWRLRLKDGPPRLILDFRELDFAELPKLALPPAILAVRAGAFRPGWSRLVLELAGPMTVDSAEMRTEGASEVRIKLSPGDAAAFRAEAARPEPPDWTLPESLPLASQPRARGGPLVVVLDPGHGGLDPGAERGEEREAELVLRFALELRDRLRRAGLGVVLTRDADRFVPLEERTSIARAAGADLFISLHADALPEGQAAGATVYTLAPEASDAAGRALAERHDRDDLLAGLDLSAADDLVAQVLMDMARAETLPRTDRLARALVAAIGAAGLKMHRQPHQQAAFSVLKSPDIPSILLELGFMTSDRDYGRLVDPAWRQAMQEAVLQAVLDWEIAEAGRGAP